MCTPSHNVPVSPATHLPLSCGGSIAAGALGPVREASRAGAEVLGAPAGRCAFAGPRPGPKAAPVTVACGRLTPLRTGMQGRFMEERPQV